MARDLSIDHTTYGNVAVVRPEGDIDLSVSPQLRRALLATLEEGRDVVVDMGAVPYIDSSGIAGLAEGLQAARRAGCRFALARPGEAALKVLRIARLDRVFIIQDTPDPSFGGDPPRDP